jgi:DNA modification methylase
MTTVWQVDQQGESMNIHPTQKPVELFLRPIQYHTEPGDICLEPFLGSGTQLIAAERLSRRCYAMEQEPSYVDVAIARWEAFTGGQATKVRGRSR